MTFAENNFRRFKVSRVLAMLGIMVLAACGPIEYTETTAEDLDNKEGSEQAITSNEVGSVFGEGGLFGNQNSGAPGIGVNVYLWRATLDTISFMPITVADPFGGVLLTDWRESLEVPGERFKMNVYILGRELRADGIRVTVLKQSLRDGQWRDEPVEEILGVQVEDAILSRARQFRRAAIASQ